MGVLIALAALSALTVGAISMARPVKSLGVKTRKHGGLVLLLGLVLLILGPIVDPPAQRVAKPIQAPVAAAIETSPTAPPTPKAPAEPPAPIVKWRGGPSGTSAMDDTPSVTYSLDAENVIEGWPRKRVTPTLFVRCQEKSTDVFINTDMAAQPVYGEMDKASVRVRFDEAPATSSLWGESTDNEAIFAPNGVAMARRIAKATYMRVEFTPFNSSPAIMTFDVTGFDQHIGLVAKTCGWTV